MVINPSPSALNQIKKARQILDQYDKPIRLQIDGGVKPSNIKEVADAGVDTFVMGSAIFNTDNYTETLSTIQNQLSN